MPIKTKLKRCDHCFEKKSNVAAYKGKLGTKYSLCPSCAKIIMVDQKADCSNKKEKIDHPPHYRKDSGFEAIDVIEAWNLDFHLGNALKYISRCGRKNNNMQEDLEKAIWYIKRKIGTLKE